MVSLLQILTQVTTQRNRIINETDNNDDDLDNDDDTTLPHSKEPSAEALAKITDYSKTECSVGLIRSSLIVYSDTLYIRWTSRRCYKEPELEAPFPAFQVLYPWRWWDKLVCTTMSVIWSVRNQDADELEWYVPSGIAISELQRIHNVIKQFLETPIDLDGKKASQLLSKKRRRRRRRSPSPLPDDNDVSSGDEPRRKKKEKKKKEKEQYKSAQFIEDSDEEYGGMDAFLEKEKAQREKASLAAAASSGAAPIPRPRPRPLTKRRPSSPPPSSEPDERPISLSPCLSDSVKPSQRSKRLISSDDDDWGLPASPTSRIL